MKTFKEELDKFEKERQELANAERLFGLPITMYPELLAVQKEMKGLEMIYELYITQKVLAMYLYTVFNLLSIHALISVIVI